MPRVSPTSRFAILAAVSAGLALGVGWFQANGPTADRDDKPQSATIENLSAMSFEMTDHEGASVGPRTLVGRPAMIFFGFTYCPDVCPTTLNDISGWLDDLGLAAEKLNTIFVTVDPSRDTIETLSDYVSAFHPRIRGWTGSAAHLKRAARAFRVTYRKVPLNAGDYSMDHTASVFLFDREGRFKSTIDFHEDRRVAVQKIERVLAN